MNENIVLENSGRSPLRQLHANFRPEYMYNTPRLLAGIQSTVGN